MPVGGAAEEFCKQGSCSHKHPMTVADRDPSIFAIHLGSVSNHIGKLIILEAPLYPVYLNIKEVMGPRTSYSATSKVIL